MDFQEDSAPLQVRPEDNSFSESPGDFERLLVYFYSPLLQGKIMHNSILIVDREKTITDILDVSSGEERYALTHTDNIKDALNMFQHQRFDLILLDLSLTNGETIQFLQSGQHANVNAPVIIISEQATIEKAVEATKLGAYDYMEKPLNKSRLLLSVRNALEKTTLANSQAILIDDLISRFGLIGVSDVVKDLLSTINRITKLDSTVLITGESGTGKELFAKVIHKYSGRKNFLGVNCAAIPHDLIESELFGHRKGSFTGAIADRVGIFQAANGGTLFLDEIGDMSLEMQAKILRALELGEVCRVGDTVPVKVDVRVIAATNKNLPEEIRLGKFREDLYYRLRVINLHIPPLRERREAIPVLAQYFLRKYCEDHIIPQKIFSDDAMCVLQSQQWHGNVRELKHVIENLAIFTDGEVVNEAQAQRVLQSFSLSEPSVDVAEHNYSLKETIDSIERNMILQSLKETNGNITRAAERLRVDRVTLTQKIKRFGLKNISPATLLAAHFFIVSFSEQCNFIFI